MNITIKPLRTFPPKRNKGNFKSKSLDVPVVPYQIWIIISIIVALILLKTSTLQAKTLDIQTGPGWIKGNANGALLGEVLQRIADDKGYVIQVEDALVGERVTFTMPLKVDEERAIRKVIGLHSHAFVFGKEGENDPVRILEVKVFKSNTGKKANFLTIAPKTTAVQRAKRAMPRGLTAGAMDSATRKGTFQSSSNGQNYLQSPAGFKKGPFGSGSYGFKNQSKGPDYRPTTEKMKEAYNAFQKKKKNYSNKRNTIASKQSKRSYINNQNRYQQNRNDMVKAYVIGPQGP